MLTLTQAANAKRNGTHTTMTAKPVMSAIEQRPDLRDEQVHLSLSLRLQNEPAVLARIALVFSRRRLRIQAMQLLDLQQDSPLAELQIDLTCEPFMARLLADQLDRIVEVSSVSSEIRAPA